jgi:hypothetical protein
MNVDSRPVMMLAAVLTTRWDEGCRTLCEPVEQFSPLCEEGGKCQSACGGVRAIFIHVV